MYNMLSNKLNYLIVCLFLEWNNVGPYVATNTKCFLSMKEDVFEE
jgi:hypothetical protein